MSLLEIIHFQIRGHQRIPSGSREFHEVTKRDALDRLRAELDKLVDSAEESKKQSCRVEFDGFTRLFDRYLRESGPSVDWDKIQLLPEGAVSLFSLYKYFSDIIITGSVPLLSQLMAFYYFICD